MKFKKIEIQFIPPNTTSLLQPLGGGIIKSFKSHFTASKLNDIFDAVEQGHDAQSAFKQIDLRNAVIYKTLAWANVSASTIRNCYRHHKWTSNTLKSDKITEVVDAEEDLEDEIRNYQRSKKNRQDTNVFITFEKYCDFDYNVNDLMLEDLVNNDNEEVKNKVTEESSTQKIENVPAHSEVLKAIFTADRYLDVDENYCLKSKTYLKRLKKFISKEKSKLKGWP